jgi:hypothetical protein
MSKSLTAKHLVALDYIHAGHSVSICTEVGTPLGELAFSSTPPRGLTKNVIDTLYRWGLLRVSESRAYGIRWAKYALSEKAFSVMSPEQGVNS